MHNILYGYTRPFINKEARPFIYLKPNHLMNNNLKT